MGDGEGNWQVRHWQGLRPPEGAGREGGSAASQFARGEAYNPDEGAVRLYRHPGEPPTSRTPTGTRNPTSATPIGTRDMFSEAPCRVNKIEKKAVSSQKKKKK